MDDGLGQARGRGLFVEGGPYGLFLLTPLCLYFVLWHCGQKQSRFTLALLIGAFLTSQSKAGFVCVLGFLGVYLIRYLSPKVLVFSSVAITSIIGVTLVWFSSFLKGFIGYYYTILGIVDGTILISASDGNIAFGRVAALFILPKMLFEYPFFGIGFGNYSLVRNNPQFLGSLPVVEGWDLPGFGMLAFLVEAGAFGFLIFLISFLVYYLLVRPSHPFKSLRIFFLLPLVIQFFGV